MHKISFACCVECDLDALASYLPILSVSFLSRIIAFHYSNRSHPKGMNYEHTMQNPVGAVHAMAPTRTHIESNLLGSDQEWINLKKKTF